MDKPMGPMSDVVIRNINSELREPNATDGFWGEVMLMEKAVFNASAAKNQYVTQNAANWAGDDYKVDAYNWITTFDSVGVVDNTQADIASFTVFRKDTCKHYMIYNPNGSRTVNFTDGQSFNVPADTIITYKVCTTTLPLTLIDFNALLYQGSTHLSWTSTLERDVKHFEVERSANGKDFIFLNTVLAKNNSNGFSNYSDIDSKAPKGISYYRLKIVDFNGAYTYSRIVAVNNGTESFSLLGIYPNPAQNYINIKLFCAEEQKIHASITTLVGQVMSEQYELSSAGINELQMPLLNLAGGTYILKLSNLTTGSTVVEKVIKY